MTQPHGGGEASEAPVVVTGASGFIGTHLVDTLGRSGQAVVGIDRRPPTGATSPNVEHVTGDLRHMDIVRRLQGARAVVHLAALPGVRPSWERFDEYVEANIGATRLLLEACVEADVPRMVIASSSSIYGSRHGGAMSERDIPAPVSPYAVTKLAAEQLALAYAARPDTTLTCAALRFFTVYGPGQRPDMLISRIISAVLAGQQIRIFGDGSQRRDFVYVSDVVEAIRVATFGASENRVYNVGTGRNISVSNIVDLIGDLTGATPITVTENRRVGDVPHTLADPLFASESLGFRASVPLDEGLARQISFVSSALSAPRA